MPAIQPTLSDIEIWNPIPTWEDCYEASNHGRIRSLYRVVTRSDGIRQSVPARILRIAPKNGYGLASLSRNGAKDPQYVHRLVALTFHGEPEPGQEVRHLDGNPKNNRADNLAWGSSSENGFDVVLHGRHHQRRKTHCPQGHRLVEPNLAFHPLQQGRRACRACMNARTKYRKGKDYEAFCELADIKYRDLMGGLVA